MIVCPNCNHPNPDGAQACEACYTPLPATTACPNCGAPVQTDASFCGQCGTGLNSPSSAREASATVVNTPSEMPDLVPPDPLTQPVRGNHPDSPDLTPVPPTTVSVPNQSATPEAASATPTPPTIVTTPVTPEAASAVSPPPTIVTTPVAPEEASTPVAAEETPSIPPPSQLPLSPGTASSRTQLQQQTARLLHVQTDTPIELPPNLPVLHIGKTNDRIPPDVDVSGFPNSEVVSRVHADIRVEGDTYYIEDVGSSNGTYINNLPLLPGNRHRLRPGDRIALGKGDLVTFLFQIS